VPAEDAVRISVRDTGRGVPPEIQEKIFDPFFTTKDVGEGTGLGLAISESIVRAHGGTIAVHSEANQGATFTVTLPRHPPEDNQ
jgi:signal transduction histidine kinase